ncbi:MAG: phytanoyl-CoA dioxygenase family protein [Chloroflexia bacterium]|nr:phytanoyl-CoA dioxygenase family protein [Chloroflexia bacterium]
MTTRTATRLVSQGYELDTSPSSFGELRDSSEIVDDIGALRERMTEDGYLFLRNVLNRDDVIAARRNLLERIAAGNGLHDATDFMDGVLRDRTPVRFEQTITQRSGPLRQLLKDGPMIAFFTRFLGGEVRPFDFIWLRSVIPGKGTAPHGDSVFMNRGTSQLFTAWTPLGDIDAELGGLIVLENSHRLDEIRSTYGQRDVDTYCEDDPNAKEIQATGKWPWNGQISGNPVELREQLGLRWLTADFRMGDLLVFTMHTLHASLDNGSADRIRLSSDTRYQLASEPIDERWTGDDPIGHGPEAMRSIIC